MRFTSLDEWLSWQETLHPKGIDLGLERPGRVLQALQAGAPAPVVITVAGTNGKGSSVAMLESILLAAGYRVGTYTSPHLLRYNERIRILGEPVSDAALCQAFDRVDRARGDESLTYFEFGTLAALVLFQQASLDVAVLEVGLGGRLDAVNLVDPDVALITAIDLDHMDWLGADRETIAREKAGIMRAGRPAACSDPITPASVVEAATGLDAPLHRLGQEFGFERHGESWGWWGMGQRIDDLPRPALAASVQFQNASGVLAVLTLLKDRLPVAVEQLHKGLRTVRLAGRLEITPGPVPRILDVAHNSQSAAELASSLGERPVAGKTHAVFAMLADKDIGAVVRHMGAAVDHWHIAGLANVPRGASLEQVAEALQRAGISAVTTYPSVAAAQTGAFASSASGDRVIVFGSFHTVAEAAAQPV